MAADAERLASTVALRGLVAGFALVFLLLGLAAVVAVRGTGAIEADTARVAREQMIEARLLNDAQAGQNTIAGILHELTRTSGAPADEQLLVDLEAADAAVERVARSAVSTPESARWRDLGQAVRGFSAEVRRAVHHKGMIPPEMMSALFDQHDEVVRLEKELLATSEHRVGAAELRLEKESQQLAARSVLLLGACLALAMLCAALTIVFARRSIRNIEWHANELGRVSWHMLQSQESAARRFSHELHDELGQSLAAVKSNLNSAGTQEWAARRADCLTLVDSAIANVRELSQLLRPVILDDFGLDASLRWLSERFSERTGVRVNYKSTFQGRLADETETHLFRIAQEAFTNIARHSGASTVQLQLDVDMTSVELSVEDNGRGLRGGDTPYAPSLGLTGMRARARQVGGEFRIAKPVGGGLRIEIRVPKGVTEEVHAI